MSCYATLPLFAMITIFTPCRALRGVFDVVLLLYVYATLFFCLIDDDMPLLFRFDYA